jgi:hypothetical protein
MVAFLASCLFAEQTRLNEISDRKERSGAQG